jgi:hypothetical protein
MSDIVVIVAIVVPAMLMATLGTLAIIMGCNFHFKAKAGPDGADIEAESKPVENRRKR